MYPAGTEIFKAKFGKLTDEQRRQATEQLAGAKWSGDNELTFPMMVTPDMRERIQQVLALGGQQIELITQKSAETGQPPSTSFSQQPHRGADAMGGKQSRQHPTH